MGLVRLNVPVHEAHVCRAVHKPPRTRKELNEWVNIGPLAQHRQLLLAARTYDTLPQSPENWGVGPGFFFQDPAVRDYYRDGNAVPNPLWDLPDWRQEYAPLASLLAWTPAWPLFQLFDRTDAGQWDWCQRAIGSKPLDSPADGQPRKQASSSRVIGHNRPELATSRGGLNWVITIPELTPGNPGYSPEEVIPGPKAGLVRIELDIFFIQKCHFSLPGYQESWPFTMPNRAKK